MFFHLCKVLFSGFLQLKGDFVDGQNISKYRDGAPLTTFNLSALTLHLNGHMAVTLFERPRRGGGRNLIGNQSECSQDNQMLLLSS